MKLTYRKLELPFEYPFTISGGRTKNSQPSLLVSLSLGNFIGYGEAPAITYYNITVEEMISELEKKKKFVEQFALTDPERYWHYVHHLFPKNPFLVCALDIACWDLFGKMNGLPLYKMWDTKWKDDVVTDYTIGIDPVDKMIEKMKAHPSPVYKIKVGTDNDLAMIETLRKHTDAVFRLDANGGWKIGEALEKISALKSMNIELIEQPLAKDDWSNMKVLCRTSDIPLFADESCVFENDVEKCVEHFHGINIKLTKCSGLTPALRMIKQAKTLDLKVMLGSMNESSVGSAAIAQLAPQVDYLDIDGPLLLSRDVATGLQYNNGRIKISDDAGLGITVVE